VGLLSWLGLKRGDEYPNLDALIKELRRALPEDESVLIRYIAIVCVLIGRVAWADGRLSEQEEQSLRQLLAHVDRLSPSGVDAVCQALKGNLPQVSDEELSLCYRELKALCDGRERVEILRLLARLAAVDGETCTAEHAELETIAAELGISLTDLATVQEEVATGGTPADATNAGPTAPLADPAGPPVRDGGSAGSADSAGSAPKDPDIERRPS
jgi:DnaJ like chaperone protein